MFTRIPFKVTNGVACFQWIMDTLIKEGPESTFACRAKITICGITQNDVSLKKFLEDAESKNLTYNESK